MNPQKPAISPELRAAIDVAKERVPVDQYFTRAMNTAVKGRTQGLWSGTAMGLAAGGFVGSMASLAILLVPGAWIPLAFVHVAGWPLILGVSSMGAALGGAHGVIIGSAAGAAGRSSCCVIS